MNPKSVGVNRTAASTAKIFLLVMIIALSCHKPAKPKVFVANSIAQQKLVLKAPPDSLRKPHKKRLYITFDDGPNKGTKNVLSIVRDENIPVSFFLVGIHVEGSLYQQQLWDSLRATTGIDLCNHSYSHANNRYSSYYENAQGVVADFVRTRDSLHLTNNIGRTPGRNIWRIDSLRYTDITKSIAAADSLQKAGFSLMGWDVEWKYDDKTFNVAFDADNLMAQIDSSFAWHKTRTADNLVLLAHDQVYAKTDDSIQLRRFLQNLKQRDDYELSLVTAYPSVGVHSH